MPGRLSPRGELRRPRGGPGSPRGSPPSAAARPGTRSPCRRVTPTCACASSSGCRTATGCVPRRPTTSRLRKMRSRIRWRRSSRGLGWTLRSATRA